MLQRSDSSQFVSIDRNQDSGAIVDNICSLSAYGEELENAYIFACEEGITSAQTIDDAHIYNPITRRELAKMISVFAVKILGIQPDRTKHCDYNDIENESFKMQYYMKASCQLGLMGLEYD
ncbi:MAG: hypothetical protein GXP45_07320 [bacterium]|nr:hypothetical protein [bacterium]